jgi:alpha-L-fucosidase
MMLVCRPGFPSTATETTSANPYNTNLGAINVSVRPPALQSSNPDPYADETPDRRDARMMWWREARFGLFIHWGVYSVPAGTYNGKQIPGIGEWIMNRGKIPVVEYREYAKQFNPVKYNADDWVKLAREAGMKYIVITSKHHDGFAMFDSKASDWNIVKGSPFGRDPLKELAAACRKYGIKLGFYYSQAQDWNNGGAAAGGKWDKAQERSMDDYIDKVAVPQMKEILGNYGEFPAVLWWDTPRDMNPERAGKLIALLKLRPGIIHNNRLGGGFKGDTETPEQHIPATGYPGRDWETCMTLNDTWGYKSYDNNWKSTETLIRNLVDIASKGGNYLLNVGPTSEGLIPEPSVERLKEIGKWMKVNGEAIYGTTASPFKKLPWGRCTTKVTADGATLYLHVFRWPQGGKLFVPGLKNEVQGAYLLADPSQQPLTTLSSAAGLNLSVPTTASDPISSTIVLRIKGPPDVEQPVVSVIPQSPGGSVLLPASEAVLHGEQLQYEPGPQRDCLGWWFNPDDGAEWEIQITRPGKFDILAEVAGLEPASLEIAAGEHRTKGDAAATGDYGKFREVNLGSLEIVSSGKLTLSLHAVKDGWHAINVKSIRMKPAEGS